MIIFLRYSISLGSLTRLLNFPAHMTLTQIYDHIENLLASSIVIDGHSDILIPLSAGKIDISHKVKIPPIDQWNHASQQYEDHPLLKFGFAPHTIEFGCEGQYDIPRWKEGGINTQVCAIYLDDSKLDHAVESGKEMINCFHHLIRNHEELELCTSIKDVQEAKVNGKIGWILSLEGCEALGDDLDLLDWYYKAGLRIASLTHTRTNQFGEGSWADKPKGGLTSKGKSLVKKMVDLGIVIDLVHISREGYWEIMDMVDQPMILSHSTPTMFYSTSENDYDLLNGLFSRPKIHKKRDQALLQALAEKGGVLGMIWIMYRSIEEAIDDIECALEIMGEDHLALGSDLYGQQLATPGLEDIGKLPNLIHGLLKRGHSHRFITKFLGANYLSVFEKVWN